MAELVGIDHVGFGSDYIPDITWTANAIQQPLGQVVFPDGGYAAAMGAKGVPTPAPYQIAAALVDTMLDHGYTDVDCAKFLGGSNYRVFQQVWG
jgi:membrane dipeptidase